MRFLVTLAFLLVACGPGIQGGPTMNNHVAQAEDDAPEIQSNDILARDAVTKTSKVKHILISWKDLAANFGGHQDPRAGKRTRAEADELATKLLARVRAGEAIEPLMIEFSEDQGSNQTGDAYDVSAEAQLVFEFRRMGLRLNVGETGLVLTQFGWHIMKRVE
jgi:peptidylprolyl isomerase/peptidyl-prolyl cis-trans isomerase D